MKLKIIDDMEPQDIAMLQALYSRSPASVEDHLARVAESGPGQFMERYYIGYGHRSIGDCGSTTLFIEGVPMLHAKAIQDWPLYSGQEYSTRYMDFGAVEFHDPTEGNEGRAIQERWRSFYTSTFPVVVAHLRSRHPIRDDQREAVYERAISARAFDIMRGFLPAGAKTNLSWHTNLRQARDHLGWLECHPDPEIVELARGIHDELEARYPHSFNAERDRAWDEKPTRGVRKMADWSRRQKAVRYRREMMGKHVFVDREWEDGSINDEVFIYMPIQLCQILGTAPLISRVCRDTADRPKGSPLPRHYDELGMVQTEFLLDFGSWRDLQRHRAGIIRFPLLTMEHGFHPWYLDELPPDVRPMAEALIREQEEAIDRLGVDSTPRQHFIPMGYRVPCRVTQALPAFVYRVELRSGKTVHPTLRAVAIEEARLLREEMPDLVLHIDDSPDEWTIRRGGQTIEERAP